MQRFICNKCNTAFDARGVERGQPSEEEQDEAKKHGVNIQRVRCRNCNSTDVRLSNG